ncbi:helix-turn-helix domain-containing protein [Enterococcus sp. BWB1-3]|uniref:helix-turn-helix domain-containing protein n=1 Tax=unclassified Enterococcus TaxID=2608891 RepID=UPI00192116A0|nr:MULTISPECIES: helix-turn-helix domain-containing protein [unclassified Enterococcus]MBL1229859.1 helix-turn-helix domain-containing protein [Enterococcus sp. BWB1-3]MCB5951375.1 helix-turn-helix domain-containing protein [Enterococcus sp. BWT-B8]
MRQLLSNHDLKLLTLLEKLNKNRGKNSLKKLSSSLTIPIRTISTYIQEFNGYNLPIYISSDNRGVRLIIPKEHSFRYIYSVIFKNSLELSVLQQIFLAENMSLDELAEKNFVSTSTVKRAISRIKPVLKKEGIIISGSNLSITGDEEKIRQFLNYFYDEKYFNLEFLTKEQEHYLHILVHDLFHQRGIKIYKNQVNKYIRWIYLNSIRIKYNHRISLKNYRFSSSKLLSDEVFVNSFHSLFGIPLTLEIINDMFYQLNNYYYYHSYNQIEKMLAQSSELKHQVQTIKTNLHNISIDLRIDLPDSTKQMLTLDFMNILQFRNSRTFILYNRREIFLEHLSTKYPHIKDYLSSYVVNLMAPDASQSEVNELIYILITHWYELYNRLHKIEHCIDIYIFVDTDLEHALFIKKELENHCRYNIKCHLMMDDEPITIPDTAILVTSVAATPKTIKNVICFSDYFSDRNWYDLNNQIRKITMEKETGA